MTKLGCIVLILALMATGAWAQSAQSGESTSRPQPDAVPSPPDVPIPDQGTLSPPQEKSKSKRALNKLDPHCIDAIFHACWSSPQAAPQKSIPEVERQVAEDIDVGYYYLRDKNYAASESRLKEAVAIKPDSTAALIGLAQAQQKLGKYGEARMHYEAYLELEPDGANAEKVRKALAELK